MRSAMISIVLMAACVLTAAEVCGTGGQVTGRSRHEVKPADATVSDLEWLTGYWLSDKRGAVMVECWLPPGGGVMLGLHRDTFEDGRMSFEYLRIMETAEGVYYYASPRGYDTTKFLLTAISDEGGVKQAVFENPDNEFPKLIRYTLDSHGLMAEVEGIDDSNNVVETWTWQRAAFPTVQDK
jgi:hypothetical protein